MTRHSKTVAPVAVLFYLGLSVSALAADPCSGGAAWANDLTPIAASDWNAARATHLIERAGFGETPQGIATLAGKTPQDIVSDLTVPGNVDNSNAKPFDESDVWEDGLDPFPPSRPATTDLAKEKGEAQPKPER